MRLTIDTDAKTLEIADGGDVRTLDLYGREAYKQIARQWMRTSWNQKYSYTFTWLGRPMIQHPEDVLRMQEVIFSLKPDVVIETGVAHGGSLIFYASLLEVMGKGRVVGVDIEIRKHNRDAIEAHPMSKYITLIEGDSVAKSVTDQVASQINPGETVLVILDSNHTKDHVAKELAAYHRFVSPGSYIVATDGLMQDLHDVPRGTPKWEHDNPAAAAREFAAAHDDFEIRQPVWLFNESELSDNLSGWPDGWIQRKLG